MRTLTVNIKSAGVNTVVDEFLIGYTNTATKVGGMKKITSESGAILVLPAANYEVRLDIPGLPKLATQTINLTNDATANFTINATPVTIVGTVRDQSYNPISEALVEVFNTG